MTNLYKNIIFAGTPEFSSNILQEILKYQLPITACLTQPDRPKGRGQQIQISPVKSIAQKYNIPVYQPKSLKKNTELLQQLKNISKTNIDVIIVVAFGLLLPTEYLQLAKYGCINIHTSLLPRWRGAAPIQHTILAGDKQSGVTIMQMDPGLDTGDILKQEAIDLTPKETSITLEAKLSDLASKLIIKTLSEITNIVPQKQTNQLATYASKILKTNAQLDFNQSAVNIERIIRAYQPWPIAFTFLADQRIRVWQADVVENIKNYSTNNKPGEIVSANNNGIDIKTGSGFLRLKVIQFPGKKPLAIQKILASKKELFQPGKCFV